MANTETPPALDPNEYLPPNRPQEPVAVHDAPKQIMTSRHHDMPGHENTRLGDIPNPIPGPLVESLGVNYPGHPRVPHDNHETDDADAQKIRFPFLLGIRQAIAGRRLKAAEEKPVDKAEIQRLERKQLVMRYAGQAMLNGWNYHKRTFTVKVEDPTNPRNTITEVRENLYRPIAQDELDDVKELSKLMGERGERNKSMLLFVKRISGIHLNAPADSKTQSIAQRALVTEDYEEIKDILMGLPADATEEEREATRNRMFPDDSVVEQYLIGRATKSELKAISTARSMYAKMLSEREEIDEEINELILEPTHELHKLTGKSQEELLSKVELLEEAQQARQTKREYRRANFTRNKNLVLDVVKAEFGDSARALGEEIADRHRESLEAMKYYAGRVRESITDTRLNVKLAARMAVQIYNLRRAQAEHQRSQEEAAKTRAEQEQKDKE